METQILHSSDSNRQTKFYFVRKSFDYLEDNKAIKDLIDQFTADYKELESNSWQEFWHFYGYDIYESSWKNKYPDYTIEGQTNKEIEEWSKLWEAHVLEVYVEEWNFFQHVFYSYHNGVKSSLESVIDEASIDNESEVEEEESSNFVAEFDQLELFGLPTSFGGSQSTRNKFKATTLNESKQSDEYLNYLFEEETDSGDAGTDCNPDFDTACDTNTMEEKSKTISKRKNKTINRSLRKLPKFMLEDKSMVKYWRKRFSLFQRFDEGIQLDRESWFSVTPEKIASHLATRLACDIIVDGFCGCGGNTIQFAKTCNKVIAIDIDPVKLTMAKHNARVYGVEHKIEFILGDFMQICETLRLRADTIFLSPPWGGPNYKHKKSFDIEKFLLPVGASKLKALAHKISDNIVFFFPRNSQMSQVIKLCGVSNKCEVENNYLDTRLVAISAFYGDDVVGKKKV